MIGVKIAISICLIFALSITVLAQNEKNENKNQKKERQYREIKTLIQSNKYLFKAMKAIPGKGNMVDLSNRQNFLKIDGEKATASMPYFGRAYSAGYNTGNGGIDFDGNMENYEVRYNDKKMRVNVNFKIKGKKDNYTCSLTISSRENVSLAITSFNKQAISYRGSIEEIIEDK